MMMDITRYLMDTKYDNLEQISSMQVFLECEILG